MDFLILQFFLNIFIIKIMIISTNTITFLIHIIIQQWTVTFKVLYFFSLITLFYLSLPTLNYYIYFPNASLFINNFLYLF